jgi:retron-type reverse transcriptase
MDRLLQQSVAQVLAQKWENEFSVNSFGFRPNKSARQAVGKALQNIHEGLNYIVDIDLKTFFDEVNHCLLLNLIYQKVKCPFTLKLIRKWLQAPIKIKGKLQKRRIAEHSRIPLKVNIHE